jgi:hypothetical protein
LVFCGMDDEPQTGDALAAKLCGDSTIPPTVTLACCAAISPRDIDNQMRVGRRGVITYFETMKRLHSDRAEDCGIVIQALLRTGPNRKTL